mmetsp:Transcript_9072/g.15332  ORF Transcript_9072/g.15332 Transcript_9072/m.15332 type:complete len:86 (+) Transcript_9072:455-712(+)
MRVLVRRGLRWVARVISEIARLGKQVPRACATTIADTTAATAIDPGAVVKRFTRMTAMFVVCTITPSRLGGALWPPAALSTATAT